MAADYPTDNIFSLEEDVLRADVVVAGIPKKAYINTSLPSNFINDKFAAELSKKGIFAKPKTNCNTSDGKPNFTWNIVEAVLQLDKHTLNEIFFVIRGMPYEVVIGADCLESVNATFVVGGNEVSLNNVEI